MKTTKECKSCGADNDPLITTCLFCKNPLPEIDPNSISTEKLIMNAGEWIGKVGQDYQEITKDFNAWTGKGMIVISSNQIEGLALKYLSLLQVRSINNPNILIIYTDLKKDLDDKRNNIFYKLGISPHARPFVIYILLVAIVLLAWIIF